MRRIATEVLVIGGGATGAGVVRDAAMRGFATALVERRDLSHGTTGRYHGLLHSGGRYVVKDPEAARECIEENRVLRRIMPHCLEDTGGYFVVTPWDDADYVPKFVDGCVAAGIPVEEVPIGQMLREEPLLNRDISVCLRVPDASADSFLATEATAASAWSTGARCSPITRSPSWSARVTVWSGRVVTIWSLVRTWRSLPTSWSTCPVPGRGRSQEPSESTSTCSPARGPWWRSTTGW